MTKALVIAPQPFYSPRGTPLSVYYRTAVTAAHRVEIDLLTYGEGQDVDIPGVRIVRIPRFSFLGDVPVGPSLHKLFLDVFILFWTLGMLVKTRYDFVHAHEEAVFIARLLKPVFGFKLIYDMHSSLPQQLTNFSFTRSRLLIGLFKRLEDSCINGADAVITICPDLHRYVETIVKDEGRNVLIENSLFDGVRICGSRSGPPPETRIENEVPDLPGDRELVVYAGTLEAYQGVDILVRAFGKVAAARPKAFLLIAGGTREQVARFREMAESAGLGDRCLFTGRVSQAAARALCRRAAVLVSPRSHGTNTPLKIYEFLDSGIPIVATDIPSHTQVLDGDVAILVRPDDGDMARGILKALTSPGECDRIAGNARKLYEARYSRTVYEMKVLRVLERIE